MTRQETFKYKNFLYHLVSSLSPLYGTLHIDQTSPISRNTCSTTNSNIFLASVRQLLKR